MIEEEKGWESLVNHPDIVHTVPISISMYLTTNLYRRMDELNPGEKCHPVFDQSFTYYKGNWTFL